MKQHKCYVTWVECLGKVGSGSGKTFLCMRNWPTIVYFRLVQLNNSLISLKIASFTLEFPTTQITHFYINFYGKNELTNQTSRKIEKPIKQINNKSNCPSKIFLCLCSRDKQCDHEDAEKISSFILTCDIYLHWPTKLC